MCLGNSRFYSIAWPENIQHFNYYQLTYCFTIGSDCGLTIGSVRSLTIGSAHDLSIGCVCFACLGDTRICLQWKVRGVSDSFRCPLSKSALASLLRQILLPPKCLWKLAIFQKLKKMNFTQISLQAGEQSIRPKMVFLGCFGTAKACRLQNCPPF